jgi:hypothetical protein
LIGRGHNGLPVSTTKEAEPDRHRPRIFFTLPGNIGNRKTIIAAMRQAVLPRSLSE